MRTNIILALLLGASLVANFTMRIDPQKRESQFMPDMAKSLAYESYSASAIFPDGKTMQAPVAGTVVHGEIPLHYTASKEDAVRAGVELTNPYNAKNAADVARGARMFGTYCEVCHGPAGKGDGTVAQRGFPTPPSLLAQNARSLPDGRLFHIMTYGQNNMPSYAAQIDRDDRWKIVLFVRDLQQKSPLTPAK